MATTNLNLFSGDSAIADDLAARRRVGRVASRDQAV